MSPAVRVIRTVLQVVLAMAVAVPTAIGGLGFDATTAGKIGAWCGGAVVVVSALWNVFEHVTGTALGPVPAIPPPAPVGAAGGSAAAGGPAIDIPALRQGGP